jgi:hypothetical protein
MTKPFGIENLKETIKCPELKSARDFLALNRNFVLIYNYSNFAFLNIITDTTK